MKKCYTLILAIFVINTVSAQKAAKSMYFELGGPGLASLNFDTRFGPRENGLGGRIGFGGFSIDGSGVVFIPVGLNYLIGKETKNYFEVGAGITPIFVSGDFTDDDGTFTSTFGHLNFGYRYQPQTAGFTFRAFITPIFGSFGFVPYYGGVSFGYKF
ncbi:MAG: hypothetical protein H7Y31_07780 [Chitinophagaceae bacterium]|nr:hypothetical protein [Chitinophagaceae bacterium]